MSSFFILNGVTFSRLMLWTVPSTTCIVNGLALKSDVEVISVQSLVSQMLSKIVPYARTLIISSDVVFTVKLAASRYFAFFFVNAEPDSVIK